MAAVVESPAARSFGVVGIVLRAATREQDDVKPDKFRTLEGCMVLQAGPRGDVLLS